MDKLLPYLGLWSHMDVGLPRKVYRDNPVKPCLNKCGKLHDHNNAYCSAECCKEHRANGK